MPAREISAVMFDLGDTLFEPLHSDFISQNLKAIASTVKCDLNSHELLAEFRNTRVRVERELSSSNSTFYLHREFIGRVVSTMLRDLEHPISDDAVEKFCDAQRDAVVANLCPRNDCTSTLMQLRASGYTLAIVSNIDDEWLEPIRDRWNLDQLVDGILSSELAQSCKPDSSIFLQACRMIEVRPQDALFVGDSLINDVEGSRSVGMEPIWFDTSSTGQIRDKPVQTITALSELVKILAKRHST
jgi:HAD superfamily hydrolase (TIGR01509 family)